MWEVGASLLVLVVLFGGIAALSILTSLDAWRAFREAAGPLGLRFKPDFIPHLEGTWEGQRVEIVWSPRSETHAAGVRYHVPLPGPRIIILPSSWIDSVLGEVTLGCPRTDAACWIQGEPHVALAMLSAEARQLLVDAVRQGVRVEGGEVTWRAEGQAAPQAASLRWLSLLARALHVSDVPTALAARALEDPEPGVRERATRALLERYPEWPQARAVAEARLAHARGPERAQLALTVDQEAPLAEVATNPQLPLDDRRRALARLLQRPSLPAPIARALAHPAMDGLWAESAPPIGQLRPLLQAADGPLSRRLLDRFCAAATPDDEALLLRLLRAPEVPDAVITAIGRVGTRAAFGPLREASERLGRRGIARAMAAIGARGEGAAGGVSLAGGGEVGIVGGGEVGVVDGDRAGRE